MDQFRSNRPSAPPPPPPPPATTTHAMAHRTQHPPQPPSAGRNSPPAEVVYGCRDTALFVGNVDEEFLCTIGFGVLVDPVMAPCQHEFCALCLETSLQYRCECPVCRFQFTTEQVVRAMKTARMSGKLPSRCDNANAGCAWEGRWDEVPTHRATCEFELVSCPHFGCAVPPMSRAELPNHMQQCAHAPRACPHCAQAFTEQEYTLHEAKCLERPVECPQQCGAKGLTLRTAPGHMETECPNAERVCRFTMFGCETTTKMSPQELQAHELGSMAMHLNLLCKTVISQQRTIQAQEHRIQRLVQRSAIVVDKTSPTALHSIAEAIECAETGDTIVVKEGVYVEPCLTISKNITIRGEAGPHITDGGEGSTSPRGSGVLVYNADDANIFVLRSNCTLQNLSIRQRSKTYFCIRILSTHADTIIEDCEIVSEHFSCIQVESHANPFVKNCCVHGSRQCGVLIKRHGRGTLLSCDIHNNAMCNVYVDTHANPSIVKCTVHGSEQHGIWIKSGGSGIIDGNTIRDNSMCDIKVEAKATPVLERNVLTKPVVNHSNTSSSPSEPPKSADQAHTTRRQRREGRHVRRHASGDTSGDDYAEV